MKEYPEVEEQFCVELQELLDRYKTQLSVPTIMRNAQRIFHNTFSFKCHPELYPEASTFMKNKTELDYLKEFLKGDGVGYKWTCVDELKELKEKGHV